MKNVVFFILIITSVFAYSQSKDFHYRESPYVQKNVNTQLRNNTNKIVRSAIDLTKCLPANYVKDASIDYTDYIQKYFDANRIVRMPNFPLLINEKGLKIKSGARIYFQNKSSLIMKSNSMANYGIISINNANNVIIYSPVVVGDRNKHIGNKGEWGMGIYILGSKNIHILHPNISNCWGDGIYIGRSGSESSDNIEIIKGVINNCRRNGISITDGKNIKIQNSIISNTNGTSPMCGIDIEPNDNKATIDSINILNLTTFNNANAGVLIVLNSILGQQEKKIRIKIENHIDDSSNVGLCLGGYNIQNSKFKSLSGSIVINNSFWKNNRLPILNYDNTKMGPQIIFSKIRLTNNSEVKQQNIKLQLSKRGNVLFK